MSISSVLEKVVDFVSDHSSEILIGLGTAGLVATTFVAVSRVSKAEELKEEILADKEVPESEEEPELTAKEKATVLIKAYSPAIIICLISLLSILLGVKAGHDKTVMLATALKASETMSEQYKEAVAKEVGPEKAEKIQDEANKNYVQNAYGSDWVGVYYTNKGNDLFFEPWTKTFFRSSKLAIRDGFECVLNDMANDGYCDFNDYLDYMEIPRSILGENHAFVNTDDLSYGHGELELRFVDRETYNGELCLEIVTSRPPVLYRM